jgi:hypothetical protein
VGHKEIFVCLSNGQKAFWIRYLLSRRKETKASFMIAMFDNEDTSGFRTHYDTFSMNPNGETKIGGNRIDNAKRYASDIENTYSISWSNGENGMSAISGITGLLDLRSQYYLLSPNAKFNGQITYLNESYAIKDYRGMVGYISQPDYLMHWTWMHMSGATDKEDMWLDLLISDRALGGKKISLLSGRINGKLIRPLGLPATFRGNEDISIIEGELSAVGKKFNIKSHADKDRTIKVKYDAVRKHDSYCYNSELAVTSINYNGRTYDSNISFIEHGILDNLQGFKEISIK